MSSIFDSIKKLQNNNDSQEVIDKVQDKFSIFEKVKSGKEKSKQIAKKENSGYVSGINLPKNNVAIPYYFSQTAIYAPRATSNRQDRNINVPIWSQGKMAISYQGPELDTKIDYKLLSIVLKARDLQPEDKHVVTLHYKETMKALGLNPYHPDSRKKFHASIERHLSAKFFFSIDNEKDGFWRSIFESEKTFFSYTNNLLTIQLSDFVPKLFNYERKETFSIEDMLISFKIGDSYASKLYSYYESNKNPFAVKISTLLKICDHAIEEEVKPSNNQRATIRKALNELVDIGFLISWSFQEDKDKRDPLVCVEKRDREDRKLKSADFNDDFLDS